mmetsp:Transcript_2037/g.6699  ORF Transcript_2037/g.6699 Transcript_2037/m.6699 type:complete len:308 (+) Transcript_2037:64-987(+)
MQLRRALGHLLRPTWRRCVAAILLYTATAHLGAGIFYAIEGGEERARAVAFQEQLQQRRELVEAALVNDTTARAALDALVSQLDEYANSKQSAPNPDALNWSFGGSLFFVLTIMTTIGYGTFVPYTLAGEVLVVVFGLVGLAVSGACLTVLADGLDKASIALLVRLLRVDKPGPGRRALLYVGLALAYWLLSGGIFAATQGWDFFTGFYYAFVTFSTIGFGHYTISYGDGGGGLAMFFLLSLAGLVVFARLVSELADLLAARGSACLAPPAPRQRQSSRAVQPADQGTGEAHARQAAGPGVEQPAAG